MNNDKALHKLVENDISFSVLYKILQHKCTDVFSNGTTFIVCYSNPPYPVWVWCANVQNTGDVVQIAKYLKQNYLQKGKYSFIMENSLFESLKLVDSDFCSLQTQMQMLSYRLDDVKQISRPVDGTIRLAVVSDVDVLAKIYQDANLEMEGLSFFIEHCKKMVQEQIENGELFVMVDQTNGIVATTFATVQGNYGKISFVYTLPTHRRKGYAINLVHFVSKHLLQQNLTPILYTDGGYVASNSCYTKIGYKQVGNLVKVGN